jgi:hypothetical protein
MTSRRGRSHVPRALYDSEDEPPPPPPPFPLCEDCFAFHPPGQRCEDAARADRFVRVSASDVVAEQRVAPLAEIPPDIVRSLGRTASREFESDSSRSSNPSASAAGSDFGVPQKRSSGRRRRGTPEETPSDRVSAAGKRAREDSGSDASAAIIADVESGSDRQPSQTRKRARLSSATMVPGKRPESRRGVTLFNVFGEDAVCGDELAHWVSRHIPAGPWDPSNAKIDVAHQQPLRLGWPSPVDTQVLPIETESPDPDDLTPPTHLVDQLARWLSAPCAPPRENLTRNREAGILVSPSSSRLSTAGPHPSILASTSAGQAQLKVSSIVCSLFLSLFCLHGVGSAHLSLRFRMCIESDAVAPGISYCSGCWTTLRFLTTCW